MTHAARPLRIVFMGTPDFAVPSLQALVDAGEDVVAVVTQPDRPKGRSPLPAPPPVKELALRLGIPVHQPKSLRKGTFPEIFAALAPDLAVVVAYGRIIPKDMLAVPPMGFVNVHASLLPRWRGAAPIQACLRAGDPVTGVTIMQLDEGLDTGDILSMVEHPIGVGTTAGDLHDALSVLGAGALLGALPSLKDGTAHPRKQDDALATHAPMLTKEDGRVPWEEPADAVQRHVRAMHPWPCAFTAWRGGILKIHPFVEYTLDPVQVPPGTVVAAEEQAIHVACGRGVVAITELQPESRRRMSAGAFLNGYRVEPGEVLGVARTTHPPEGDQR
ncbi:MAG: methionyl-tRNA formyltransferase [Myxococcales bacterium]